MHDAAGIDSKAHTHGRVSLRNAKPDLRSWHEYEGNGTRG